MPEASPFRYRFHGRTPPDARARTPLLAQAPEPRVDGSTAVMRLYDPVDSWGGPWGVSAREFVDALDELGDEVTTIELHVNSPGGEVFEGIAILNALRQHRARVVTVVDGLAASAASFIAMAGDEVVMAGNTELMIHDAWGLAIGNAEDMRDMATRLDQLSDNIAGVYARRSGTPVAQWRTAMLAETWYSAEEAVAAGLADRVEYGDSTGDAPSNAFDLSMFRHAGRREAPAPPMPGNRATDPPAAPATGSPLTGRSTAVAFTDEQLTTMRQQLGLPEDADETAILAGLSEALEERADDTPPAPPANQSPEGTVVLDQAQYAALVAGAEAGQQARETQLAEERTRAVQAAVADGRIPPARRDHWLAQLERDPGAAEVLATMAPGLVPVAELGYDGDAEEAPSTLEDVRKSPAYANWS